MVSKSRCNRRKWAGKIEGCDQLGRIRSLNVAMGMKSRTCECLESQECINYFMDFKVIQENEIISNGKGSW